MNSIQLRDLTGTWSGETDGNWSATDSTSSNFSGLSFSAVNSMVNSVYFGDTTATGLPVLSSFVAIQAGGVLTGNVYFQNKNLTYTIASADSNGITGFTAVTVQGGGTVNFTGPHTYTGPTTISAGRLLLSQGSSLGGTQIFATAGGTFAAQPTGGATINVGSDLSLAAGSALDMSGDASTGTLRVAGALDLGDANGGAALSFDLGTDGGGNTVVHSLAANGSASLQGTNRITIVGFGSQPLTSGIYPLITASSGLDFGGTFAIANPNSTVTVDGVTYRLALFNSSNLEQLGISSGASISGIWQATGAGSFVWNSPTTNWSSTPFVPGTAGDSATFSTAAGTNSQSIDLDMGARWAA